MKNSFKYKSSSRAAGKSLSVLEVKLLSAYLFKSAAQLGFDLPKLGAIQTAWAKLKFALKRTSRKSSKRK